MAGCENYQYLNMRNSRLEVGIGFGGDSASRMRLFLSSDFDVCRASAWGMTYSQGPLVPASFNDSLQPLRIQALGFGGASAAARQSASRQLNERITQNMRKVDKSQFANSAFDREFLLGKTFQKHR